MRNTFVFASIVSLVCSLLLALTATTLRPLQLYNVEIDQKKNILVALGFIKSSQKMKSKEIEGLYGEKVKEVVLNAAGEPQPDKTIADIEKNSDLLPLYMNSESGSICFPVEGMGLWSLLQGYFALQQDGRTVAGMTFYEQKETAGLGAEIAKAWFQNSFIGKSILNSKGEVVSVTVVKGKAKDASSFELDNVVDGISGATITGNGVTDLLQAGLVKYRPYLEKLRQEAGKQNPVPGGAE